MKTALDFLTAVVESKRARLTTAMREMPLASMRVTAKQSLAAAPRRSLRQALLNDQKINIIAEIKRASPSKGNLGMNAAVEEVASAYSRGGAAVISVLTEEDFFRGSLNDLRAVRNSVSVPVLRKDFIFDEYQVYESAAAGADCLLLIAALLNDAEWERLRTLTETLRMDALVEVHTLAEMRRAEQAGVSLIGVNNRNLSTFEVSTDVSLELIAEAPGNAILISESGLRTGAQLRRLRAAGYGGFLIGEALVSSQNPEADLRSLIREAGK